VWQQHCARKYANLIPLGALAHRSSLLPAGENARECGGMVLRGSIGSEQQNIGPVLFTCRVLFVFETVPLANMVIAEGKQDPTVCTFLAAGCASWLSTAARDLTPKLADPIHTLELWEQRVWDK